MSIYVPYAGADLGFQVRGAHLKKSRRAEEGANIFGVFRVKNHDFTQKNHIFSNLWGGGRPCTHGSAPIMMVIPETYEHLKLIDVKVFSTDL